MTIPTILYTFELLSTNVFKFDMSKILLFCKELNFNPFPNKSLFLHACSTSLLKTLWEKEKLLVRSNFSFSHSVFYPFGGLAAIFIKLEIVVCKLFQFGRVSNLLFGKGLAKRKCFNSLRKESYISATFNLLSANPFNLVMSKSLVKRR